tara:strand:+ start:59 stop:316 length:258 start_codon:yes stop_codon:yes gene_type:complete
MSNKKSKKKPHPKNTYRNAFERRYREVDFKKDDWMLEVLKICKKRLERNSDDFQARFDVGLIKICYDFSKEIDQRFKKSNATTKS